MGYKKINIDFFTSLGQVYCPPLTITYDSTGRLTKEAVTGSNGEFNIGYTYDNAGNRTAITGAVNKTYSYDANNRLLAETSSYNTVQYTYDNNGNQTKKETCRLNSDGTKTVSQTENFAYNGLNQLVNYDSSNGTTVNNKSASYKYMANCYRLSKTLNYTKAFVGAVTEETRYLWDKDNIVAFMDSSNDVTHRYYRGYQLLCDDEDMYYMHDSHGNVIETYKPNQTTPYDKYFYNSYGTQNGFEDTDMIESSNEWGYCDQLYDGFANGNYYMRAREYNPGIGRFISEDPIRDGSNWYSYCGGNPVKYYDWLGLAQEDGSLRTWVNNRTNDLSYINSSISWNPKTSTATVTMSNTYNETSKTASFRAGVNGAYISNGRMMVSSDILWQTFGTIIDPGVEVDTTRDTLVLAGLFVAGAKVGKAVVSVIKSTNTKVVFGSATKSVVKLANEMADRGWTKESVLQTVKSPFTTRVSKNLATNNPATAYYTKEGAYVVIDDITREVVQVSDAIHPEKWIVDKNIINPYIPK